LYDADDFLIADLLEDVRFFAVWQEEGFESGGQASHLNFSIQSTLVTADAIHDARDVVKLVLDLRQKFHLCSISLLTLKEVLFFKRLVAIVSPQALEQLDHQSLSLPVIFVLQACF